jgi:hypothetical protein
MNITETTKQKTDKNWETYRKQRNLVTKLKKTSIKTYFFERTAGGPKSSTFYPTIKPFLSSFSYRSRFLDFDSYKVQDMLLTSSFLLVYVYQLFL